MNFLSFSPNVNVHFACNISASYFAVHALTGCRQGYLRSGCEFDDVALKPAGVPHHIYQQSPFLQAKIHCSPSQSLLHLECCLASP